MKKIVALLLIFSMLFTLSACGERPADNGENSTGELVQNEEPNIETQKPNEESETPSNPSGNDSVDQPNNQQDNASSEQPSDEQPTTSEPNTPNTNSSQTEPSAPGVDQPSEPEKPTIDLTGVGSVVCFGDSITEGMQVASTQNYPSFLQRNLGEQITVFNGGVSGETSATIMSRANAVDFTLANAITFEKGQKEIELNAKLFVTASGEEIYYRYGKLGNGLPATKIKIDGKAYTLSVKHGNVEDEHKYCIARTDSSKAVTLKKGVKIEFDYSEYFEKRYCTIVLMGANDDDLTVEQLIARYKEIAKTSKYFIAIIPHYGTDYAAEFEKAFPNATVNLREYCKEQVWQDYDFTKTKKDDYFISTGNIAAQFVLNEKKGDCHLSEKGYRVLADLIYKKGVEMGIWN